MSLTFCFSQLGTNYCKNETFSRIFKHYEAVGCCKHFLSGKVAKELQHHVRGRDSCHVHARAIRQVFYKYQIFLTLSSKWNCKITLDFKCGSAPSFSRICTQLTRWLAVANIRGVIPSWNVREKCTNIGFQYRITDHQHRDNLSFHFLSWYYSEIFFALKDGFCRSILMHKI